MPDNEVILAWDTFDVAADQAGQSRLFGSIHFLEGDVNGRDFGTKVGTEAYILAQQFFDGTATGADRPFFTPEMDALMM